MTDDIVARLREDFLEQIVDEQPYMVAETYKKERHEAADEIELLQNEIAAWKGRQHGTVAAMQAEIERLRAALGEISAIENREWDPDWDEITDVRKIANAALVKGAKE